MDIEKTGLEVQMQRPQHAADALDADLASVRRDELLELALDDLEALLREPDAEPFAVRRGPYRTGLEDLALTLSAATRLPDELKVRVRLPAGTSSTVPTLVQAAFRQRAADAASASWRDAMAVRSMGRRQLPIGAPVAVLSAVVAYAAGYLATVADSTTTTGLFVLVSMITITIAWVVSWMVIETAFLDWRQPARRARAFDLLARATLEVATDPSGAAS
jgi:hypothetical protein